MMNEMMFYRVCINALELKKDDILEPLSQNYTKEWFDKMKNNKHCEWGQVCMALKEAKKRHQKLCDIAENELKRCE